jgi:DNA-binding CsgD family transcriptional regulator
MPAGAPPVPAGPRAIVGREPELRRVEGFLDAVAAGPVALVVEGEVGIGKTALWRHGLEAAAGRSYRVLSCRPIDTEAQLAYTALGDLLVEVPDAILGELPGPQRHALEVALLRAEPEERQSLPRAVALGLLGVLRALAQGGPTLVAVDDVQWLDQPSRSALAFVARRLTDERVGLLVARRLEGEPGVPLDLDRALPAGRLHRLEVGSLAVAELDRLLAARLPTPLPRRTLLRLHRVSGGNPFFAQEIALTILRNGAQDAPTEELPVPASLQGLLHDRLALLAPPALEAVQTVAALSRPTVALVDRLPGGREAVEAVAAAGVVELDAEQVRFAHPLLASVALAQLSPSRRRELHGRLAAILDDPEERGRHLALAAARPDAEVASSLDDAARRASARGAPDAAAVLWEQARRLTPAGAGEQARRRGIEAAERHFDAGDAERARALLQEVAAEAPPGRQRAHALARLGWVRAHREGFQAGADAFRAALASDAGDVALRVQVEEGLAWCLHSTSGLPAAGADRTLGRLAALVAAAGMHEPALFRFHGDAVEAKVALGHRDAAQALLDELDRLGAALQRTWVLALAGRGRGLLSAALGDPAAAYRALEAALELHDHLGEPFERARTLLVLGSVQRRDRKKRAARQSLEGALEVFDRLGAALWAGRTRSELARVGGRAPAAGLTPTEERVARLIAAGHTYRETADALFISPKTVQWNLSKVYRKLGVRSRAELAGRLPADRPVPDRREGG